MRVGDPGRVDALFYSQPAAELGHIFEFERGLEVLLACSLRRAGGRGAT